MDEAPLSLGEAHAALAAAPPDRPAVTCGDRTLTRAELEERTNRLACAYIDLGVTPDSFVTIGLPNGIEFVEATLATWKAGATPQPVSHRMPPAGRQAIVNLVPGVADPSDGELAEHLRARLVPKVPRSYERASDPVRDDAGKVRRTALRTARLSPAPDTAGA